MLAVRYAPPPVNAPFDAADWRAYFAANAAARDAIPWDLGVNVEPRSRAPLARSLQRYQVGESGDGRHLLGSAERMKDADYSAALALFVGEEQEHARLLAGLLDGLSAPLLASHWSDRVFVLLRRAMGLRLELLVLLIAEIIARRYYRALHEGTLDVVTRAVCAQIMHDEVGHVAFHCAFLRGELARRPGWLRWSVRAAWSVMFRATCLVVALDHRGVLRACGVRSRAFQRESHLLWREAADVIFGA
jgi:hypothetical protein